PNYMILASIHAVSLFPFLHSSILTYLRKNKSWEFVSSTGLRPHFPSGIFMTNHLLSLISLYG
ncbi:MAG: hypothetical protein LBJ98_00610, partial [Endomicrobium sp.]|nr:hypothetical protein [Endomicrobium sp.]